MKRVFDAIISSLGLLLLGPVFLIVALMIKLDSRGPVFFKQARIGREFRSFFIYKFRTMIADAASRGGTLTVGSDPRITRVGAVLRTTKIDEIPQLINIFKGDMSFVGPRPEVLEFVELFRSDYEEILRVRPGLTDLASLKYRNEAMTLAQAEDPHEDYLKRVLPDKIRLAKEYIRRSSFLLDLGLIIKNLVSLFECRLTQ